MFIVLRIPNPRPLCVGGKQPFHREHSSIVVFVPSQSYAWLWPKLTRILSIRGVANPNNSVWRKNGCWSSITSTGYGQKLQNIPLSWLWFLISPAICLLTMAKEAFTLLKASETSCPMNTSYWPISLVYIPHMPEWVIVQVLPSQ